MSVLSSQLIRTYGSHTSRQAAQEAAHVEDAQQQAAEEHFLCQVTDTVPECPKENKENAGKTSSGTAICHAICDGESRHEGPVAGVLLPTAFVPCLCVDKDRRGHRRAH